ncbi:MAG: CDP-diacylglycerol--glycerol-3-phosphate 3-phosphatidyltransferase [Microbacteriaceae bacterium]
MTQATQPSNWNAPNIITGVRILAAPFVFWLVLIAGDDVALRWWATVLFVLVIATDGIDGAIARKHGLVTGLGKILDPIADKLVTNGVLICLSILGQLPWWVTGSIVLREVGITIWRLVEVRRGNVVPASSGGKLKTIAQSVAIPLAIAPLPLMLGGWMNSVNAFFMTLAFALTVWTGLAYLRDARALRKTA